MDAVIAELNHEICSRISFTCGQNVHVNDNSLSGNSLTTRKAIVGTTVADVTTFDNEDLRTIQQHCIFMTADTIFNNVILRSCYLQTHRNRRYRIVESLDKLVVFCIESIDRVLA